ncbi:MAG: tryptophan 7-halogenase [Pseudomonadota bacterium]
MRSARTRTLQSVAIVGAGFEGTLAASWLAHTCRGTGVRITLVPVPGVECCDSAYCALPARPDDLLSPLGISDLTLLKACQASFALGVTLGERTLPFGSVGLDFAGSDFHHHWLLTDREEPYFAYSPAWQAMQASKFAPPVSRNAIGPLQHEFTRLMDIRALTHVLTDGLDARGVQVTAPLDATLEDLADDERRLKLVDGDTLDADLIIDARGNAASEAQLWLQSSMEDGSASHPAYTLAFAQSGWELTLPLAKATLNLRVQRERDEIDGPPWQGHRVRIGAAAHALTPLLPWYSSLLMRSIRRLAAWLPPAGNEANHRQAFNQQTLADIASLRSANALVESALGNTDDDLPLSALELWRKRGVWHDPDCTLLNRWDWISLLFALGHLPATHDPLAERFPAELRAQQCARLRSEIGRVTSGFPTLSEYLAAAQQAGQK